MSSDDSLASLLSHNARCFGDIKEKAIWLVTGCWAGLCASCALVGFDEGLEDAKLVDGWALDFKQINAKWLDPGATS